MSQPVNPQPQPERAPDMTALSTAFPMQFEPQSARPGEDAQPAQAHAQPAQAHAQRAPHRHEAGE